MSVKIIAGVNELKVAVGGKNVGQIKNEGIAGLLNLTGDETVKVNGVDANDSVIVKDGDIVEFVKKSGTKGSVSIASGVNQMSVAANGKTVATLVEEVSSLLNLTGEEDVKVNGSDAGSDYILKDGDKVEFVKASGTKGSVKIVSGVNEMNVTADGKSVSDLTGEVSSLLNLTGEEDVKVNGADVNADYVIQDGDRVEFVKASGTKGDVK